MSTISAAATGGLRVAEPFALVGRLVGAGAQVSPSPATVDARVDARMMGAIIVDRGKIAAIESPVVPARLPAARLQAAFVAPGLCDLQVNGGFGFEVGDDPGALRELAERLPRTGVTAFLPTLVSRGADDYRGAFAAFDEARARTRVVDGRAHGARMLGLHLEGPLLAPARAGAHEGSAIAAADAALVDRLADPTRVRLITLAPERSDALALIARLKARGVIVALGHSDASFDEFTAGIDAGATVATHVFNAMSPFHHRRPGAVGAALLDDRVVALVIADGVHVHPAALALAVRAKGVDRLALVTDAIAGAGLPPGKSRLANQTITVDATSARLDDGTLAGSILTMDGAVRNAVAFAGLPPEAAIGLGSAVPAGVLGAATGDGGGGGGRLAVGADADIVLFDQWLGVAATFVGGTLAYSADPDAHARSLGT